MINDETDEAKPGDNLLDIPEIGNAPVSPALAVGSVALNFALKYHDINTVQDGTLYQQYKLEGKNMECLHLDMVFETAMRIEKHLMGTANRLSTLVLDAVLLEAELSEDVDAGEGR